MKIEFIVSGMTCAACVSHVERAAKKVNNEYLVNVNLATNRMTVEAGFVDVEKIISAISLAGYNAKIFDTNDNKNNVNVTDELVLEAKRLRKKLILSLVFVIPLFYLSMGPMIGLPVPNFVAPTSNPLAYALSQMALAIPIMCIGYRFYTRGFKSLFHLAPNMDSLIAIGTLASFAYSVYSTIRIFGGDAHAVHELYFESCGVIITLIHLGKSLEAFAKGNASKSIRKLIELAPKTALVLREGKEIEVLVDDVVIGDVVIVKPGMKVPIDGIVIDGYASIDESMLTGESMPVEKNVGNPVFQATILSDGLIKIKATKLGQGTTLAQIVRLVEEAQGSKAMIAKLADKVAGVFVPIVFSIAIVALVGWLIAGESFSFALTTFVSVLVIACPCALGLATPTAIIVGSGKGAELGIIYKTGQALEYLQSIDTIVFDKTGTITNGKPKVVEIHDGEHISKGEVIRIAASVEKGSNHPIAKALTAYAIENNIDLYEIANVQTKVGKGISAKLLLSGENEKTEVFVGNQEFIIENCKEKEFEKYESTNTTKVFVATNNHLLGVIEIADTIKDDSVSAVKKLKSYGLKVVMLTGDNEQTAKSIANEAGIDNVLFNILPQGKSEEIKKLQALGNKVAMVGDGINDAPALTQANIGIAIGSGTDVAIESADVVLMHDSLMDVATAIDLSKKTIRNIKQNLFFAFAYNSIGIPIAAGLLHIFGGPLLNPMIGAAAMSLSSVSVVSNALRLKRYNSKSQLCDSNADGQINCMCDEEIKGKEIIMKTTINVPSMMCVNCERHVKNALNALEGVQSVEVDLNTKDVMIEHAENLSVDMMKKAIIDAGYEVKE